MNPYDAFWRKLTAMWSGDENEPVAREDRSFLEPEILQEDEVSIAALDRIFKNGFMKTRIDQYGDLVVSTESFRSVVVRVDRDRKMISFLRPGGCRNQSPKMPSLHWPIA